MRTKEEIQRQIREEVGLWAAALAARVWARHERRATERQKGGGA